MEKIIYSSEFFNVRDTLCCGQIFRFIPYLKGYKVFSLDKCAYVYNDGDCAIVECEDGEYDYFYDFFDLRRDYSEIVSQALNQHEEIVLRSAELGKGIRILNQNKTEVLFSFIISQNNNITRIKGIIEKLCMRLGKKKTFLNEEYFSFPFVDKMAKESIDFYKSIGLGYRAPYIKKLAENIENGLDINLFDKLSTRDLTAQLMSLYGVGNKVANCVTLFGFKRTDSFPVDTWIEKVYKENFNGELNDRSKIADWFVKKFGNNSGYIQQYLFYYKRSLEKNL